MLDEFFKDDTKFIMGNCDFDFLVNSGRNGAIHFSVPLYDLCLFLYLVLPL